MNQGNLKSLAPVLLDLVQCLLRDIATHLSDSVEEKSLLRDVALIERRTHSEGISFLTKTLPTFAKHLEFSLEHECWKPIAGFRRSRKGPLPLFLGGLVGLVFDRTDGSLRSDPPADAVSAIRQVAYSFYKLEFPMSQDMVDSAVESYKRVDRSLPEPTAPEGLFPLRTRVLLRGARLVVSRLFDRFNPRDIDPRHGPGAVATGESRESKWDFKRIFRKLHEMYPYYEYFYASRSHFLDSGRAGWFSRKRKRFGVSKYTLVPKDSRGPRGISMEPLELQYIQQGLFRSMKTWIERHPLTSGRVNFTSQEVNRRLALSSSVDRRFATVDMKEASDRVSLWLVRQLFAGCPELLKALEATRSAATRLPNGQIISLRKFAPMGSALCFPIEAIVFYALLVSIRMLDEDLSVEEAANGIYVYGDDLIITPQLYMTAASDFMPLGLRFNGKKSFAKGSFRESCGLDAFAGVEVTPTRFRKVLTSKGRLGPGEAANTVAVRNSLYCKGYFRTAAYLDRLLSHHLGELPRIPCESQVGFLALMDWSCGTVSAHGVASRYNANLQRIEVKAQQVVPVDRPSRYTGWPAVQQYLLQGGVPTRVPAGSSSVPPKRVKRKWFGFYKHSCS